MLFCFTHAIPLIKGSLIYLTFLHIKFFVGYISTSPRGSCHVSRRFQTGTVSYELCTPMGQTLQSILLSIRCVIAQCSVSALCRYACYKPNEMEAPAVSQFRRVRCPQQYIGISMVPRRWLNPHRSDSSASDCTGHTVLLIPPTRTYAIIPEQPAFSLSHSGPALSQ